MLPEVRPAYLEVCQAYLKEVGTFPKPCLRKQGNLKPYLRKGGKFWGHPWPLSRPGVPQEGGKFQNHTSGRREQKFPPFLRYARNTSRYAANTSEIPEVLKPYLTQHRKTIPQGPPLTLKINTKAKGKGPKHFNEACLEHPYTPARKRGGGFASSRPLQRAF